MDFVKLDCIIYGMEKKQVSPSEILKEIKKIVRREVTVFDIQQWLTGEMDKIKKERQFDEVNDQVNLYLENEVDILTDMIKKAYQLYVGEGTPDKMMKYLEDNFDIYPKFDIEDHDH